MLKLFKPDFYVKSINDINIPQLKAMGIKIVLCDLDNTLVAHHQSYATDEVVAFINKLEANGLKFKIVSNNDLDRVKEFSDPHQIEYLELARKPLKKAFKNALKNHRYQKDEIVMIGDQMMTDILGANRYQIKTILVDPVVSTDIKATMRNRKLEKIVLKKLASKNLFKKGEYYGFN